MEAMSVGYPPEQKGQISVTATKGEWMQVIDQINSGRWAAEGPSEDLVHWLINQGVYED